MALVDNAWYVNYGDGSAGAGKKSYWDVTQWSTGATIAAGALRRQLAAPAVGSERVFVCVVAGTTHASTEPTWTLTRGALTTDNTVTWQECTGIAALNGDATNTPSWTITTTPPGGVKNTAVTLGQLIKRDSGASYQICTTAGTAGNGAEPSFSNTAGVTTSDNTVTWTSLGVVGNFTGWQAPHARGANALTTNWLQAGNKVFVGDNHAETQAAALTWALAPLSITCVDRAGSLPPVSADLRATATVTATGANTLNINCTAVVIDGFIFTGGSGTVTNGILVNGNGSFTIRNSALRKAGTSANGTAINFGGAIKTRLVNTTMQFGNTGDSFRPAAPCRWENTPNAITGATLPTTLMSPTGQSTILLGVDLSALGSSATIVNNTTSAITTLIDCKLPTSAVFSTPSGVQGRTTVIRSDSSAANYRQEIYSFEGTLTAETTIVRTGGATDGTTPISWKIATTASSRWDTPFESFPISIWNESTAAITTLTFYGTTTGGGVPNNDDIWVDVEYLGSALSPQGSFVTTTKADMLGASATTNNSSDASTWGGAGAGNGFKIVVPSFTPGMKGPINILFRAAKASTTFYIDPRPVIS